MPVLYLRETEIAELLTMPAAIEAMERAFAALAAGEAVNVPRVRAQAPGVVLHSLNAAAEYLNLVGWKQYTTTRQGAQFLVGLHDAKSGSLQALLEADLLGQLRTGAVSGLAVKFLSDPRADALGLFGAGWQARSQLAAIAAVRPLQRVHVFSRDVARRRSFAAEMSREFQLDVVPVDEPRQAVEFLPIVVTATTSKVPVFDGRWLTPGTLVCAMGSNWTSKAEIDVAAVETARRVVCDSVAACQAEAGDFIQALAAGVFHWRDAVELADVVSGKQAIRASGRDCVVFKSVGLGIEDVALGAVALQLARERGVGLRLPIG